MPTTKKESIIFGIMMVLVMVYGMVTYNIALSMGGLSNITFLLALKELPLAALVAFLFESFVVSKIVDKKLNELIDLKHTELIYIIIIRSSLTVIMMCTFMSLCASIYHNYTSIFNIIPTWIETVVKNFPMALCYQLFIVGPLVRSIFSKLFKGKLD